MGRAATDTPGRRPALEPRRDKTVGEATRLVHAGRGAGAAPRTVGPPIQSGSTVLMPDAAALYDDDAVTYGRGGLASRTLLAAALAELEGATAVRLFPSGLAALTGAMLAVLQGRRRGPGRRRVYNPTRRFCDRVLKRFGVAVRYFPPTLAPDELIAMAGPATRLILLESPGSLTFEMQDAPAIAAPGAGARRPHPDGQHLGRRPAVSSRWTTASIYRSRP